MIIPLLIFVFVGFYFNWLLAISFTLTSYVFLELLYKYIFLKKLQKVENINFPSNTLSKKERMSNDSKTVNISKLVACIALPVLMIINLMMSVTDWNNLDYNSIILIIVTVLCVISNDEPYDIQTPLYLLLFN